ncbi:hypothetical protein [Streptomyces sp. CBMA123]|nr:hypothetical protein [Streptomyces sp. CBMA123]
MPGSLGQLRTMAPAEENGYGPNFEARKARISGCWASAVSSIGTPGL